MKTLIFFILLFTSVVFSESGYGQTGKTIIRLQEAEQACLDSGVNMLGCTRNFYSQMDSLLNVVYKNLRGTLESSQKSLLKKEQKLWLQKRDAYFKKTLSEFKKKNPNRTEGTAQDDAMYMYESNAEFVKNRILNLLGRFKNK